MSVDEYLRQHGAALEAWRDKCLDGMRGNVSTSDMAIARERMNSDIGQMLIAGRKQLIELIGADGCIVDVPEKGLLQ